jgi:hypothetical protein
VLAVLGRWASDCGSESEVLLGTCFTARTKSNCRTSAKSTCEPVRKRSVLRSRQRIRGYALLVQQVAAATAAATAATAATSAAATAAATAATSAAATAATSAAATLYQHKSTCALVLTNQRICKQAGCIWLQCTTCFTSVYLRTSTDESEVLQGSWVHRQRVHYEHKKLSTDKLALLREAGKKNTKNKNTKLKGRSLKTSWRCCGKQVK